MTMLALGQAIETSVERNDPDTIRGLVERVRREAERIRPELEKAGAFAG